MIFHSVDVFGIEAYSTHQLTVFTDGDRAPWRVDAVLCSLAKGFKGQIEQLLK
ncbi:hypothetical protein [Allocoleopsis franciscana]|uniref:hypothetical protein n=1 Tax=Allocoleopsis franciscana TaxID=2886352 RepID=UPI0002D317D1|nr:hypothetical protein [Allocoleopsis franciscana]